MIIIIFYELNDDATLYAFVKQLMEWYFITR